MKDSQKLHVDVITKFFYPVAGGIENNIMQTYTTLQNKFGWDVTIHTTADSYTQKNCYPEEETINTLKVQRYPSNFAGFTPGIDWQNTNVIALHNFDIFFLRYLLKALWLKIQGKKSFALILTPHGGYNPEWSMFSLACRICKQLYTYTLGTWLINATVDGVRAVSDWELSQTTKHIKPHLVRTIDNGLEDEAYMDLEKLASEKIKADVKRYGKYIIQIGRVYAIKNFETTIEALRDLPQDYKFVIVGQLQDEEYKNKLFTLIKDLKLENRVIFTGVLRGVEKYYLIKHAQAMSHMALWESYGNVLREGMSQGLPIITSNVYNMPLLVKDGINGFCLPVHDAKAVAEKLNWLFDPQNQKEVEKIKQANIELGKNQSWADVARKMDEFYKKSLNEIKSKHQ